MLEGFFDSFSVLAKQANTDNTSVYINNVDTLITKTTNKIRENIKSKEEERG